MITAEQAVAAAMLICLSGALVTLLLPHARTWAGWIALLAVASSSLLLLYGVATVLLGGPAKPMTLVAVPQLGFALRLYVDGLSALFLGLIATVALPSTLYSIEYMSHRREHGAGRYYPNFLVFVAGMYGLVSTTDMMYGFGLFWQMMTLAGYALIRHERRRPENAKAAVKYFWMMQIACAAAMLGAGILAGEGRSTETGEVLAKYDFDAILYYLPCQLQTQGPWAVLAFTLFLVGFGIKLGMWPFGQIWLPDAHPAAPSPVSAMLSGVMIKTGLYGLMRCFLWWCRTKRARTTQSPFGARSSRCWGLSLCSPALSRPLKKTKPSGCWPSPASAKRVISCWAWALA